MMHSERALVRSKELVFSATVVSGIDSAKLRLMKMKRINALAAAAMVCSAGPANAVLPAPTVQVVSSLRAAWIRKHVHNFEKLDVAQQKVVDYFLALFWSRLLQPGEEIKVYILAEDKKLTDLEEFAEFKNKTIGEVNPLHFANKNITNSSGERKWDDLRGCSVGSVSAVGIENFMERVGGYRHIFFHEMGHVLFSHALSDSEKEKVQTLYQDAKKRNSFLNDYSEVEAEEYFAEAIEAYAGKTKDKNLANAYYLSLTRKNLASVDPLLYNFINALVDR